MTDHDVEHSLFRIPILVHKELLTVLHSLPKVLISFWILVLDIFIVLFVVYEIDSLQILGYECILFLLIFNFLAQNFRDWILALKIRLLIKMLREHVVETKFFNTESFTNLSTSLHAPEERRCLNDYLVKRQPIVQ